MPEIHGFGPETARKLLELSKRPEPRHARHWWDVEPGGEDSQPGLFAFRNETPETVPAHGVVELFGLVQESSLTFDKRLRIFRGRKPSATGSYPTSKIYAAATGAQVEYNKIGYCLFDRPARVRWNAIDAFGGVDPTATFGQVWGPQAGTWLLSPPHLAPREGFYFLGNHFFTNAQAPDSLAWVWPTWTQLAESWFEGYSAITAASTVGWTEIGMPRLARQTGGHSEIFESGFWRWVIGAPATYTFHLLGNALVSGGAATHQFRLRRLTPGFGAASRVFPFRQAAGVVYDAFGGFWTVALTAGERIVFEWNPGTGGTLSTDQVSLQMIR